VETGPHRVELGGQIELGQSAYDSVSRSDRAELADLFGLEDLHTHDIHVRPDGASGGVYAAAELMLGEQWTLLPGIRWDGIDYDDERGFIEHTSMRLGVRYAPTPAWRLRFDAGRFYQAEALHEMQVSDGLDEFTAPQHADHWIAGVEWRALPTWQARAEVYGKRYPDPKPRFENAFNPFALLPEVETDRIPISPDEARVNGMDVEVRHAYSEALSFTARYSAMDASDRINGAWVSRRWSQRHTLNAIVAWQTERASLAGAITWHSGWRTSAPPAIVAIDAPPSLESLLNDAMLRDFLSFDIRASRWWTVGRSTVTLFVDVVNVANRHNSAGVDYDIEEIGDVLTFSPDREGLLPIVPSIGVLIAF
jgi:outer membrane receptor protein involved in Fe transport